MWAPNGMPPEILSRMSRELAKALTNATLKARYADLGAEPIAMETPEFRKLLVGEAEQLSTVIREQKISMD
ncbi:MAG: transporter substrate-binding protein [Rhodoferax sp.]|nr:transporter substrate-binding protein [Rhodoferax sp.]